MHLLSQTIGAAGSTPWIIPNPLLHSPTMSVALTFSSDAHLTCTVEHTFDDPTATPRAVSISRSGTSATVTDNGHQLNTGDNVLIWSDPSGTFGPAPLIGDPLQALPLSAQVPVSYKVQSITDQNNYVITVPNSGSLGPVICTLQSFRVFPADAANLVGVTGTPPARVDGNYAVSVGAVRLTITSYTAGKATLSVNTGLGD